MRQERLYVLVGLFVGGAISLTILTALYIYDEYLNEKVETYVMFFKGSLTGVHVASDVTYRGVKIGEVKLIEITENPENNKIRIPVYVQFFVERKFVGKQNPIQLLINRGYVANISKPNFLTGIASIDLIRGPASYKTIQTKYNGYPIFPTNNKVEDYISLDDALRSAKQAFQDISAFVQSARMYGVIDATTTMAVTMERMVKNLDRLIPTTLATLSQSLKEFSVLVNELYQQFPPTLINFSRSMKKVSEAANSTQNLTNYLARYPESLLRGKK
jgi:ABC-type transporter Mla subunit MlaD